MDSGARGARERGGGGGSGKRVQGKEEEEENRYHFWECGLIGGAQDEQRQSCDQGPAGF